MNRRVIFLGLAQDAQARAFRATYAQRRAMEIWTMNDWYQYYPAVPCPDRVFNIHADITSHAADASRFPGDTIQIYNDSMAEIVTTRYFPELDNCRPFDLLRLVDITHDPFFSSSMSVMFVMAWLERWEEIELIGVQLAQGSEFAAQAEALLGAIVESERRGIKVIAPYREQWEAQAPVVVDWHNAGCDYRPYWATQYQLNLPWSTLPKAKEADK